MDVKVARYDDCRQPSYLVGFSVSLKEDPSKSVYLDALVPMEGAPETQEGIARKAWENVKDAAEAWAKEQKRQTDSIVGKSLDV